MTVITALFFYSNLKTDNEDYKLIILRLLLKPNLKFVKFNVNFCKKILLLILGINLTKSKVQPVLILLLYLLKYGLTLLYDLLSKNILRVFHSFNIYIC